eukprot:SAG31_NODE_984_length_10552_cov_4.679231_12_plen_44_part_00
MAESDRKVLRLLGLLCAKLSAAIIHQSNNEMALHAQPPRATRL